MEMSFKHPKLNDKNIESVKMAHYEPSHLVVHCLQRNMFRSAGLKELNIFPLIVSDLG